MRSPRCAFGGMEGQAPHWRWLKVLHMYLGEYGFYLFHQSVAVGLG
jgi:hypothetical protein